MAPFSGRICILSDILLSTKNQKNKSSGNSKDIASFIDESIGKRKHTSMYALVAILIFTVIMPPGSNELQKEH